MTFRVLARLSRGRIKSRFFQMAITSPLLTYRSPVLTRASEDGLLPDKRAKRWIDTVNPANGRTLRRFRASTRTDVEKSVEKARKAFEKWRELSPVKRADFLQRAAKTLRSRKEKLGRIMTLEMGKTIKESVPEVAKCAWALEYFAESGPKFLNPEAAKTDATDSYVAFEPLGVIGSIMPWNFPLWQCVRFAAPSLMVGNTAVFKPSSVTPQSGLQLQEVFDSTGVPPGTFNVVLGSSEVASYLIEANTAAISFTGSVPAGQDVATQASSQLKKVVLELGGERLKRKGFFYPPTILTEVKPDMPVMKEETFGPAAPVMIVKDDDEAVRYANNSEFGLGSSVWSRDVRRAEKVARQLQAGLVTMNNIVVSDPRMPFGGVKKSGIGRKLSRYGMLEL